MPIKKIPYKKKRVNKLKSQYRKKTVLTKPKRAEVRKIVNRAINSRAESKYFETTNLNALTRLAPLQSRNGNTSIAVLGFAVGTGNSPQMSEITYGWQNNIGNINVIDLNCSRVFATQDPAAPLDELKQNSLEGSYASPSMCKTEWFLQVPQQDTTERESYGTPTYVRVLRVRPRKKKYADLSINPKNDLFVNQWGIEQGINGTQFNELELLMFKPNSRKYEVIEDSVKYLQPASTIATLDIAAGNTITTDLTKSGSNCKLVMNHKMPKKLYYVDAVLGGQPQDGQSSELIFFHFCKQGTGGDTNSNEKSLEVSCKPVSTFKDF